MTGTSELGPLLGRLASPATRGPASLPLDNVRLDLVSALYEQKADARREGRTWLGLWRTAAHAAAARCLEEVDRRFAAAAAESRIPARRLASHRPTNADRQAVISRCESAGIPLEQIASAMGAEAGPEGLLRLAMALDDSWERLVRVVDEELHEWAVEVSAVRAWHRPRRLLWAITAGSVLAAVLLGLSLGGYLPAPGPLAWLQRWWWRLPWP